MELSKGQAYALLTCMRVLECMCSKDIYCGNTLWGIVISFGVQVLVVLLAYRLPKRVATVLVGCYCVVYSLITVVRVANLDGTLPNGVSVSIGIVALVGVCWYCASLGVKALTRSALIVGAIVGISLAVVLWGLVPNVSLEYANVGLTSNGGSVLHYTLSDLLHSVDLVFLLSFKLPKDRAFKYLGCKMLSLGVLTLVGVCVLGGVSVVSEYPLLELATYSQPFGLQRCDAIYTLIATLMCVLNVSIALQTLVNTQCKVSTLKGATT
jgi:hypothetical protein